MSTNCRDTIPADSYVEELIHLRHVPQGLAPGGHHLSPSRRLRSAAEL